MSCYYSRVLINKPGQELVDTLQFVFEAAMLEFKKKE